MAALVVFLPKRNVLSDCSLSPPPWAVVGIFGEDGDADSHIFVDDGVKVLLCEFKLWASAPFVDFCRSGCSVQDVDLMGNCLKVNIKEQHKMVSAAFMTYHSPRNNKLILPDIILLGEMMQLIPDPGHHTKRTIRQQI